VAAALDEHLAVQLAQLPHVVGMPAYEVIGDGSLAIKGLDDLFRSTLLEVPVAHGASLLFMLTASDAPNPGSAWKAGRKGPPYECAGRQGPPYECAFL
jgi:hypothetical protein